MGLNDRDYMRSSQTDRLWDLKAGGAFLAWNYRDFPLTCTVMLCQAACYATFRLCESGRLPINVQIWFFQLFDSRLLSVESIQQGRYYTLVTSVLFMSDFFEVLMAWIGLWFILSYVEYAFRWFWALVVLLLPCAVASAAFLLLARWNLAELDGSIPEYQKAILDFCRPKREGYLFPWRLEPLWLGVGTFALLRMPNVRALRSVPIWMFFGLMLAAEFTVIQSHHGQQYAWESITAAILTGVFLAALSCLASWIRKPAKELQRKSMLDGNQQKRAKI
jgi:hypothetical protein